VLICLFGARYAGGWEVDPPGGKKRDGMKRGERGVKRGYQSINVLKEVGT
jgi:hypothetical protein